MLSILAIAASLSLPIVNPDGSLERADSDEGCAGAGEGVLGAFWAAEEDCAGAAGVAGVFAGAGVEGVSLLDDAADGLGFRIVSGPNRWTGSIITHL
jgi:hypothetical protein